ncbi:MAG: phosphatidate cytidylyltransferase [Cyclobacteriaceae bacterium]|nr:phosphatidate cytidylyltransferase [Cyclobacteriaceae bacterium]
MTSALNKYNNLTQRVIAGLVGVFIIIAAVGYSDWAYFVVFFLLCMATQLEFYKLTGLDGMVPLKWYGTVSGLLIFTISFLEEKDILGYQYYFLVFPIVFGIFLIKLYKKSDSNPFVNIGITFLGIIYVAIPFSLLNVSAFSLGHYSYEIVLGLLLMLWASDTGAYFAGTYFGRRKLFERISPKKTWEGFIGGLFLAIAMAYGLSLYFHDLNPYQWIMAGVIMTVCGTYGDLVESLFKRSMSIKDSGTAIPGHGGFLDRFDGLLLSIPFIITFLEIFWLEK